ncbi:sugar efflux transporter [Chengkuizengella sediminis]|uniref:sugar efflux transporter n=1 Tax=Chengkuizengella sediminis TaxID=1885917 RepID=UPI001389BCE1|nr:sugar efflux transporter [Chengkuizengella sediminis]NDI35732.1 MFS transporter [Chengkuizengella sediminis]
MNFIEQTAKILKIPEYKSLILLNILFGISASFIFPYNSMFGIDEVGMSNISFGVFMTISAIVGIFISTYIGKLSDGRYSRKSILIVVTISAFIAYVLYAYVRNYFLLLFIASFFIGIASSGFPQVFAYAREAVDRAKLPSKEMPYAMNLFRMFFALSWTVGPAIAAFVLLQYDFKGLFLVAASGYLLIFFFIIKFLKHHDPQASKPKEPVNLREFITRPYIFANLFAFILIASANTVNMMNMPQFITKVLNGTEANVGWAFSIPPIFEIPFMLGFGLLAARIDSSVLIKLGVFIATIYFSILMFVEAPWQIYVIQFLSAAYISITNGIAISYFQDFIPDEPGTATTLYMNTSKIGSTLGFLLFGFVSEYFGYREVVILCMVFMAIAFCVLLLFRKDKSFVFQTRRKLV